MESEAHHQAAELNDLRQRLEGSEFELQSFRASQTWKLAERLLRLKANIVATISRKQLLPRVVIKEIGPRIEILVSFPRLAPHEKLLVRLHLREREVLQEYAEFGEDSYTSDSGDLTTSLSRPGSWVIDWRPSTPIGSYQISDLRVSVSGVPSALVEDTSNAQNLSLQQSLRPTNTNLAHLKNSIREFQIGDVEETTDSGKVAVISAYVPETRPTDALLALVQRLSTDGYYTVVVDTSPKARAALALQQVNGANVLVSRRNIGWDFSSWISTLVEPQLLELMGNASEIIWTNDSCFGPFGSLKNLLDSESWRETHVLGMTSSNQIRPHLQSYFLRFNQEVVGQGTLTKFAQTYTFPSVKSAIIQEGEVALTDFVLSEGHSVGACFPYESVVAEYLSTWSSRLNRLNADALVTDLKSVGAAFEPWRRQFHFNLREKLEDGIPVNPTHELWDTLLDLGFPFLKRELIQSNPLRVPLHNLRHYSEPISDHWFKIMESESKFGRSSML